MNCKALILTCIIFFSSLGVAKADEVYEGDQRLACEALLCLTVGWGESECQPAIREFFSIWSWKPSELFSKRLNFLGLCPSGMDRSDQALIVNYSGRCTGDRFSNYVSGYGSYTTVEMGNGGWRRASCSWNDKEGVWAHRDGVKACTSTLSYARKLLLANRDCESFRSTFGFVD